MSVRAMNQRDVDGAGATLARDIERTWRNWHAFIQEKRDEFAAAQQDEAPETDLTGTGRPALRVAKLDTATRQQFGAVLESRRQQAQGKAEKDAREQGRPAPDADQVYSALLQHILNELDGTIHPSGMALVWYKDALIKFDAQAVMAGTTEADYLGSGTANGPNKQQAVLALGVLIVLLIGLFFLVQWAFGSPVVSVAAEAPAARVGSVEASLWVVRDATVGGVHIPAILGGSFPPTLCVDAVAAKQAIPGATIILTGTGAVRRYQVQPDAVAADLQLVDCTANTTISGARLLDTRTRDLLPVTTLTDLVVRGPDLDPQAIPAGQMEVTLIVALPDVGAGALILADGRRWGATTSTAVAGGTQLTYLVPLAETVQVAGWEIERLNNLPLLLPLSIPAPEVRATVIGRLLSVEAGVPTIGTRDGMTEIALELTITLDADAAPLQLLPTDLKDTANDAPLLVRWEPPMLTPERPQTVTLRFPVRDQRPVEVALATWRARLTTE